MCRLQTQQSSANFHLWPDDICSYRSRTRVKTKFYDPWGFSSRLPHAPCFAFKIVLSWLVSSLVTGKILLKPRFGGVCSALNFKVENAMKWNSQVSPGFALRCTEIKVLDLRMAGSSERKFASLRLQSWRLRCCKDRFFLIKRPIFSCHLRSVAMHLPFSVLFSVMWRPDRSR